MQAESLDALLNLLGDGPEPPGTAYGKLHVRLTRYFRINACADPEQLADEVLNRLAKVAVNDARSIASPTAFALGIARHVLQENTRALVREAETGRNWTVSRKIADPDKETALQAIDECLAGMPTAKSNLLRTYYASTGKQKIEHHRQLAERLGITINTLRNRLMRARRELDACVRSRLSDVSPKNRT
jgi:DNA-directed RNA polymerase specialized sigma24 family protein